MMNFWPPDFYIWGDNFDPSKMPFFVQYDYDKIWSYDNATDSFQFEWEDQFDLFDEKKWLKSHMWTFDRYYYVKVWSYEQAADSFVFKWVDEFDTFDLGRWQKSNWWSFH